MSRSILPLFLILALIAAASAATAQEDSAGRTESSAAAKRAISAASGRALQGDIRLALAELRSVPEIEFGVQDRRVRACLIERFHAEADGSPPADPGGFAGRVIGVYRAYWRAALSNPETRPIEEERLQRNLGRLIDAPAGSDPGGISDEITTRLAAEGYNVLMGRTPPLLEMMIWGEEETQLRNVPLPEGEYEITVKILDDFASLGWSAYATCDRSFTGGWVGQNAIHAVRPGWRSLDDENFRISFLAHETQHFADRARFDGIDSPGLEYRAKLTELALAQETIPQILTAFASNQGDDPNLPHSHANKRVLDALRGELALGPEAGLSGVSVSRINAAARALLIRDSAERTGRAEN